MKGDEVERENNRFLGGWEYQEINTQIKSNYLEQVQILEDLNRFCTFSKIHKTGFRETKVTYICTMFV